MGAAPRPPLTLNSNKLYTLETTKIARANLRRKNMCKIVVVVRDCRQEGFSRNYRFIPRKTSTINTAAKRLRMRKFVAVTRAFVVVL